MKVNKYAIPECYNPDTDSSYSGSVYEFRTEFTLIKSDATDKISISKNLQLKKDKKD